MLSSFKKTSPIIHSITEYKKSLILSHINCGFRLKLNKV